MLNDLRIDENGGAEILVDAESVRVIREGTLGPQADPNAGQKRIKFDPATTQDLIRRLRGDED